MPRKPAVEVRPYPSKPKTPWAIDARAEGKRIRLFFATKAEAEAELTRVKIKHRREGQDALSIPDDLRIAARDIQEKLNPFGKTLWDAGKFYLKHLEDSQQEMTISDLAAKYLG